MLKKSVGLARFIYIATLLYVLIFLGVLAAFFISFLCGNKTVYSPLLSGFNGSAESLQKHIIFLWAIFIVQIAGVGAFLKSKPLSRQLIISSSAAMYLYFLYRVIFEVTRLDVLGLLTMGFYLVVILFLMCPEVKKRFEGRGAALRTILVVDDDRGVIKVLKNNLMASGFKVLTAETGEQGLVLAQSRYPDLIILDVILPGIKGREVCQRLKQGSQTKDIPVIFLTSKNSEDDIQAELAVGGVAHLTKPIDFPAVLEQIQKILKG